MGAVARTRALLDQQLATEKVVQTLREEGYDPLVSISALIKAGGLSYDNAKTAVIESPVWADHREKFATNQWIAPPETPDGPTLERMREVCLTEPVIAEAWITGSRFTRLDGASHVSTSIALVLDAPVVEMRDQTVDDWQIEFFMKLAATWPTGRLGGWMCVTRGIIAAEREHCLPFYARAQAT